MKKLVLALVISGFVLAGCKQTPNEEPEFERQVQIQFAVGSLANSKLKSAGTVTEDAITEIILYGLDATGNVVRIIDGVTLSTTSLNVSSRVTAFWAIANPTPTMKSATPATSSVLEGWTRDYSLSLPDSPFTMSGIASIASNTATIVLVRSIAKIAVAGAEGFNIAIESIEVKNARTSGYVFPQVSLPAATGSDLDDFLERSDEVYVAENDDTPATATSLTVTGTYASSPFSVDIDMKISGSLIPIERNKFYTVTLEPSDPVDPWTFVITIKNWDDVDLGTVYF